MNKFIFAAVLLLGQASQTTQAADFAWPGGARLAVSLGYDDALASQLDNALPALNAHGLKATFYLTLASATVAQRLPEWRRAAEQGHELGNHSLFHPCSRSAGPGREWVAPHRDLDKISATAMREEVQLANVMLNAIDGQRERTYTAPCTDPLAAGQPYMPGLHGDFIAIKSHFGPAVADIAALDPYDVPTGDPSGLSGAQLIALVEKAAQRGGLISFTFHGVGGDHLSVTKEAHEALLAHLASKPGSYWVANFATIMKTLRQTKAPR